MNAREPDHTASARPDPDRTDAPKPAEEPAGEEEKIMANRPDVNMTAFLTRDVQGG